MTKAHPSPSLLLAIRDAREALQQFGEHDTGITIQVPIEALRWLVYGAESFASDKHRVTHKIERW